VFTDAGQGLVSAFIASVFTADVIEPNLGECTIGFVMAANSAASALVSVSIGRMSDRCGGRKDFTGFPYVCPEPVLVKRSFYMSMAQKVSFFASFRHYATVNPGAFCPDKLRAKHQRGPNTNEGRVTVEGFCVNWTGLAGRL
jgi:MFS family permease